MSQPQVVTRFAPSPTGLLHAGNYRTALFAYLFARQQKGKFIVRIEDTDRARSKKEYEDNILESLKWLGLDYDAFYRQSERTEIHAGYIQKLIDSGHAFISKETPKEAGDRTEVIRFKNPNKKVSWNDSVRGKIEFDTTDLGDFVIARSMTEPVFHLVVVVDDHEMGVTHVIRGEDHISNTPRHILLYEALGLPVPQYVHLPLLLSEDRSKLSKRKGALPVTAYRDRGFLSSALINYLAMLGWNPGPEAKDKEIFSVAELISIFDFSKIQKSGAIFSEKKLAWYNRQYLLALSDTDFAKILRAQVSTPPTPSSGLASTIPDTLIPLIREKISTFAEVAGLTAPGGELSFIHPLPSSGSVPSYNVADLKWKNEVDISATKAHLKFVLDTVKALSASDFTSTSLKNALWPYAEEKGKGNVLWPMRYALSGQARSPDPFVMGGILGKDETLARLTYAYNAI